jgi:hypothetical protein
MSRQFRRLQRIRLHTTAQRQVPLDFIDRTIAAYAAHPWTRYSAASVVHYRACGIRRGGGLTCTPEVFLKMPGGELVEVDPAGRCKRETRQ